MNRFWERLFGSKSLTARNGRPPPSQAAPEKAATRAVPATSQVAFKRETRKQHPLMSHVQTITKTYTAPDRDAAVDFLRGQNITESFLYIEVETPSGVFGTDRMGEIYDSGGMELQKAPSQSDIAKWKALSETFHDEAEKGNLDEVRAILSDNPNLVFSRVVFFGESPLHAAAGKGRVEVVKLLLDKGADANVRDQNLQTPLHDTAGNGHIDVVKLLVDKGADVNARMHGNSTPLSMAAARGHRNVAEFLRKHGGHE